MTHTANFPLLLLQFQMPGGGSAFAPVFMYGAIFAIFYFLLIRPQQQQRKKHEETIRQLKRGDEVVTAGGVVGEVLQIRQLSADAAGQDDRITIKSGESRLVVERGRIAKIVAAAGSGAASSTTPAA
jgi:preprotein translocase subunit YajC